MKLSSKRHSGHPFGCVSLPFRFYQLAISINFVHQSLIVMEYFKTFNGHNITISFNKKRITSKHRGTYNSIYGGFVVCNDSNDFNNKTPTKSTKWKFKINSTGNGVYIGIASFNNVNDSAFSYNSSIGYWCRGAVFKDGKCTDSYNSYQEGDIIIMIHNPCDKTITFKRLRGGIIERGKTWYGAQSDKIKQIKGGELTEYPAIKMNDNNIKYKMCVCLTGIGSSVELLSCDQYTVENQQNDNDDNKIQTEEKEKDLKQANKVNNI